MKIGVITLIVLFMTCGCKTTVVVPTVEPWEGRYPTVEEFQEGTKDIQLKDGQQIWVLSNGTMYRLLKKTEK